LSSLIKENDRVSWPAEKKREKTPLHESFFLFKKHQKHFSNQTLKHLLKTLSNTVDLHSPVWDEIWLLFIDHSRWGLKCRLAGQSKQQLMDSSEKQFQPFTRAINKQGSFFLEPLQDYKPC
jgi:hypothetical protein